MAWRVSLISLAVVACSAGGPGNSSAPGTTKRFAARDFTSVALDGPDEVEVHTGSDFAVEAQGAPATLDRLEVRRAGETLRIARKPHQGWWPSTETAVVRVRMPAIHAAAAAGSGAVMLDRAEEFEGTASGSGDLTAGMLEGRRATLTNTGSGTIAAAGTVGMLVASTSGSGDIAAAELHADRASVVLAGSGEIAAHVAGAASVALHGAGTVDLGPMARCTAVRRSTGTLRCGD
ncbi:GIN domain-containing protein [Sphingomonas sp. ac-8]|uniref:GIN domain-containing protein n=1 Tax=Sphingomonas sp. ac-8 TaxID=3242977 RepID=UPI003A7F86C8